MTTHFQTLLSVSYSWTLYQSRYWDMVTRAQKYAASDPGAPQAEISGDRNTRRMFCFIIVSTSLILSFSPFLLLHSFFIDFYYSPIVCFSLWQIFHFLLCLKLLWGCIITRQWRRSLHHHVKITRFYFQRTIQTKIATPEISLGTQDFSSIKLT
jgi:hypothetical protein